jgi:hypothetical protein
MPDEDKHRFSRIGTESLTIGVPITGDDTKIIKPKSFLTMQDSSELDGAGRAYLNACGLTPTPDAVQQLTQVFLPCLRIMCERPWDPNGGTWRRSGFFGILTDVRKKFERLWERGWQHGKMHDDSAYDLINYLGMYLRSDKEPWGEWGPPGGKP